MHFDPTDTSKLLSVLNEQRCRGEEATQAYLSRRLPLCMVASLIGQSVYAVCDEFSRAANGAINTAFGNPAELELISRTCPQTPP